MGSQCSLGFGGVVELTERKREEEGGQMSIARVFWCHTDVWKRSNALLFLYFSDSQLLRTSPVLLGLAADYIDAQLTGTRWSGRGLGDRDLADAINSKITKLKDVEAGLGRLRRANRLLWIRFAFQNMLKSIAPTQDFLDWFAMWRYDVATGVPTGKTSRFIVSQRERTNPSANRSTFDYEDKRYPCYPIDYFFLNRSVPARLDSDMDWVLLPEGRDVDKGIAKRKKVERIIGANAYQVIEACIREAATQKKIVGLRNEKIDGRYVCEKTRLELAQSLRRRFRKKVIYEESTVVRVLSDFVACPRHRKGFRK